MTGSDPTTALIVVDMQNDFCPGGALGVEGGDLLASALARAAEEAGTVVATRDAHPADHISFAARGGPWPPHCVVGTGGAELHPSVAGMRFDRVQDKSSDPDQETYSGFDGTGLGDYLRDRGVKTVVIGGLATDYCVRATALAALEEGFETTVLTDAIAAVEVAPGDGRRALAEVAAAGGRLDRLELLRDEAALRPILDRKAEQLREVMDAAGRGNVVIGLSGGIDSAVAMALAARTLGPEHVVAVRLPSRHTEQVHVDDAAASAVAAGLPEENLLTVSIDPMVDALAAARPTRSCSVPRTAPRTCSATSPASATPPLTSSRSPTSTRARCVAPRVSWGSRRRCSTSTRRRAFGAGRPTRTSSGSPTATPTWRWSRCSTWA
jgi:nicotinamidase-related amidase